MTETDTAMLRVGDTIVEIVDKSTPGIIEGETELVVTDGDNRWRVGPDLLEKEYDPISEKGNFFYEGIVG